MQKLYIIESNANGTNLWCGVGTGFKNKFGFNKYWLRHSLRDQRRFNPIMAHIVLLYLKLTHKWMKELRIKKEPFKWWEKNYE